MIRSVLLPRVRARREASRLSFVPRELSAEEQERLVANHARGAWDRDNTPREQARAFGQLMGTIYKARIACYDRDAVAHRPMPDEQSWGGRG